MKQPKVLVTGATGFVGNALLKELSKKGYDISVLTRDRELARVRLPVHCELFECDLNCEAPPSKAFEGVSAVVHLAGENIGDGRWTSLRKKKIRESRINSTANLVRAMEDLPQKPEVLISASATGYYGNRGDERLDENSTASTDFLGRVCADWEEMASRAQNLGIRTAIYRFGVVLGFDGGAIKKMWAPFQLGFGGRLGTGRQWMSWIHINDLARALVHAIEHEEVEGVFNAVSPDPVRNFTFTKGLEKAMEQSTPFSVPVFNLKILLGEMSQILLDSQWVSSKKLEQTGFKFQYPELGNALDEINRHSNHQIQCEQWIPFSNMNAFLFFGRPKNMEMVSPPALALKVGRASNEEFKAGDAVPMQFSFCGIPIKWISRIKEYHPGKSFSDTQLEGPFADWNHAHHFESKNGGTLIRDRIEYRLPLGVLGDLAVGDRVKKELEKVLIYRMNMLERLFG